MTDSLRAASARSAWAALLALLVLLPSAACTGGGTPTAAPAPVQATAPAEPPVAKQVPHRLETHGDVRIDEYYWLREREDPEVIAYLGAENEYTEAVLAHTEALQEDLYEEIVGRIPQEDESAPVFDDGYWYYRRFEEGEDYPVYLRKKGSLDAPEEVILDGPELARGHDFFSLQGMAVSPDGRTVAYGVDTVGRRRYTIRFKDLATGETLPDEIRDKTPALAWAADSRTLFYTGQDPQTLRADSVYRHVLGTDPASDPLVYAEEDEEYRCFVSESRSDDYLLIGSFQTETSEYRYLPADDPAGDFRVFAPRDEGHRYTVDHAGDRFYVLTNDTGKNFRLASTPVGDTSRASWSEVVPHREEVYLEEALAFRGHLALAERRGGLTRIRVLPRPTGGGVAVQGEDAGHFVGLDEESYTVFLGANPEVDTDTLRFDYSSLTTPWTAYDYSMDERELRLIDRQEVPGGFDPADYRTERLLAPARDGERIPVSIVYGKDFRKDGSRPLLLHGYGSYGATIDPSFDPARLSLLDRGFAFAIAHVRGGQIYGREWYEQGRLLHKKNTFTDFVDVAEHLVAEGYADPGRLYARGGSAGGLLMGAVVNLRPDLWDGVVAHVPFVDVVTTMLDETIPLTTFEYDEWGDPREKEYYDYMLSYSPYDNVEAKDYPDLLVTTGLHDSQVQYWEPAKWVARLRERKTDDNRLLLKTNMEAGHGGASGRFRKQRETALEWAFLLDLSGQ